MQHIEVALDDHEFAQAATRAQQAGISVEEWIRDLVQQTAVPTQSADPLFGLLADEPELADAVVAERGTRPLRRP